MDGSDVLEESDTSKGSSQGNKKDLEHQAEKGHHDLTVRPGQASKKKRKFSFISALVSTKPSLHRSSQHDHTSRGDSGTRWEHEKVLSNNMSYNGETSMGTNQEKAPTLNSNLSGLARDPAIPRRPKSGWKRPREWLEYEDPASPNETTGSSTDSPNVHPPKKKKKSANSELQREKSKFDKEMKKLTSKVISDFQKAFHQGPSTQDQKEQLTRAIFNALRDAKQRAVDSDESQSGNSFYKLRVVDKALIDMKDTHIEFTGSSMKLPVSEDMLGRIFNGSGAPVDKGPKVFAEDYLDINGDLKELCCFYVAVDSPLAIKSCRLAHQPVRAGVPRGDDPDWYLDHRYHELDRSWPKDPHLQRWPVCRTTKSRLKSAGRRAWSRRETQEEVQSLPKASTTITKTTSALSLRPWVSTWRRHASSSRTLKRMARGQSHTLPQLGKRSYDLSTIYERAGRVAGRNGSITQIPILTMPNEDMTHPIPDLTGYITEGQIYVDRQLHNRQIYPPIQVLGSLSRLMKSAIGEGMTRKDHGDVSNSLYALYATGRDCASMKAVVGEDALSAEDKLSLEFLEAFERRFINQGAYENRTIYDSLDIAWSLMRMLPKEMLTRINPR
ncbi:hypothetical protein L7F22_029857 [Adiantum nelumboides]|nr:hypothetical protein [Adiantum nelumboides]